ncbi:hypothetical protein ENBRE01_2520 [Enteropsectra breve]|nr:hypothetical protein ENBRE01_2520 [Enteropsectra breve]
MENMMENLEKFLILNLNENGSTAGRKGYKEHARFTELLDIDVSLLSESDAAIYLYIKNLILEEPAMFNVPNNLPVYTRALMLSSMGKHKEALSSIGIPMEIEFVGAVCVSNAGAHSNRVVLKTVNTISKEMHQYALDGTVFRDFKIQRLHYPELLYLYIKMQDIAANLDNPTLRESRILALLQRALHTLNYTEESTADILKLKTAFLLSKAELTNETSELEKILEVPHTIDETLFCAPICFRGQLHIQVGRSLMKQFDFGAAYKLLSNYPVHLERIECLIALKDTRSAIDEIEKYIAALGHASERRELMLLSELHIKLGHLYQNVSYFDRAACIFPGAKPHHVKGLFYMSRKEYDLASGCFAEALKITPCDENIQFLHGCALVGAENYAGAMKVFRRLKAENPKNENIVKNLSYCYYKLNDIEGMLEQLRSVALQDAQAMRQFLYLSIKNEKMENVKWALGRTTYDRTLSEAVNFLIYSRHMTEEDIRKILESNHYFDHAQIDSMFL